MQILTVTEELLALNECVLDIDEGPADITQTCRLATDGERFDSEVDADQEGLVCAIGDDGKLLLEYVHNGTMCVPLIYTNGLQPLWQSCLVCTTKDGTHTVNEPSTHYNCIKTRAHGRIRGKYRYQCAWFPTS